MDIVFANHNNFKWCVMWYNCVNYLRQLTEKFFNIFANVTFSLNTSVIVDSRRDWTKMMSNVSTNCKLHLFDEMKCARDSMEKAVEQFLDWFRFLWVGICMTCWVKAVMLNDIWIGVKSANFWERNQGIVIQMLFWCLMPRDAKTQNYNSAS